MTRVVVHIDKLILRGIDRTDARAISAAIESQMKQLLAVPMLAPSLTELGDRRRVKAGVVGFQNTDSARHLGRSVAKKIVQGVTS